MRRLLFPVAALAALATQMVSFPPVLPVQPAQADGIKILTVADVVRLCYSGEDIGSYSKCQKEYANDECVVLVPTKLMDNDSDRQQILEAAIKSGLKCERKK